MISQLLCLVAWCGISFLIFGCCGDGPNMMDEPKPAAHLVKSVPADGGQIIVEDALSPEMELKLVFEGLPLVVIVNGDIVRPIGNIATWVGWPKATYDPVERKVTVSVDWLNFDNTIDEGTTLDLHVDFADKDPPQVIGGTITDGQSDVDPDLLYMDGIFIEFSEPIAKATLLFIDEIPNHPMAWLREIKGNLVVFDPCKAGPCVPDHGTTYVIRGSVEDTVGNRRRLAITFRTKERQ